MKFTIEGFSQKAMLDLELDLTDVVILRWFVDFKETGDMNSEIFNNDKYYWINYDYLIEQLPCLNIKKDRLGRRLKALCKKNILKSYLKKLGGTYTYYCTGENFGKLVRIEQTVKKTSIKRYKNRLSDGKKTVPKIHLSDHSSIINNNNSENVVVDIIKSKFFEKHKIKLSNSRIETMLKYKTSEYILKRINEYKTFLDSFTGEIKTIEGLFQTFIIKDLEINKNENKRQPTAPDNMNNFEQREYKEEYFEKYYYQVKE